MSHLIRNVRPYGGDQVDVLVRDGVIAGIGAGLDAEGAEVLDAAGAVLLPGLVDLHTHLREPGREDAETVDTGTRAAARGGFTAVHAMANTDPVADTAGVVEQVWRLGREAGHCDVFPVGAVTVGLAGVKLAELGAMADSAARVRVFSDDGKCVSDAVLMRRSLEYVKAFDGVVAQHAQEPRLTEGAQMNEGELSGRLGLRGWPAVAEEAIIARDCLLAAHVGSRLHICHVSTAGSVELIRWAKGNGWDVTAEVTPHHLLLTDELAATYDPIYKVNPPLRSARDVEAVRAGLADGTIDITVLVSSRGGAAGNDASFEPTISADGRYVAFTTWATDLTRDTNGSTLDVLVKDMQTGRLQIASVTSGERQRDRNSFFPVISDDGGAVSFQTFARLGRKDDDRTEDVYVRDLRKGVTRQGSLLPGASRDVRGPVLNGDISADGSVVVFGNANNLWARNVRTGETIRFHQEADAPPCQPFPMGSAGRPVISGNGRFAAFASCATDLPGEDGQRTDVYRINLENGRIVRAHPAGDGNSYLPSLSRNGRFVGFGSEAANLVPGDDAGPDAFVADARERTVTRASQAPDGSAGNSLSATTDVSISGNGHVLAYVSYADNLVEGDAFDLPEVFVWRR